MRYRILSHRVGISNPHDILSIDDCRYIRIVKLVLKMLHNICVVIKTTTACVCRRAKGGATQQLELQGELVRKMVSIQEEILRKLE